MLRPNIGLRQLRRRLSSTVNTPVYNKLTYYKKKSMLKTCLETIVNLFWNRINNK